MDQYDRELLQKQMCAINSAPQRGGVIMVTVLMVFFIGMALGSLLAGPTSEPTRVSHPSNIPHHNTIAGRPMIGGTDRGACSTANTWREGTRSLHRSIVLKLLRSRESCGRRSRRQIGSQPVTSITVARSRVHSSSSPAVI